MRIVAIIVVFMVILFGLIIIMVSHNYDVQQHSYFQ